MEKLYQIYLITNIITKKQYIGQVVQDRGYQTRFKEHINGIKHANTRRLSNSIKKYSPQAFIVDLIEENIPESDIDKKEKYYIDYYNTLMPNGYNMTLGGQGVHGYKHTDPERLKMSNASKKNWEKLHKDPIRLQERNHKVSLGLKGIKRSEETRHKLSVIAKERFKNNHGTFYGKKHTDETKRKLADKNGYKIIMCDKITGDPLISFVSAAKATKWLLDNNKTKNKSAFIRILTICNKVKGQGKTAYGYIWKYLE